MGEFITTTACKFNDPDVLSEEIVEYCRSYDVPARILNEADDCRSRSDATLFAPKNGWIVIDWPTYFGQDIPIIQSLSLKHQFLASNVSVHDGDFWWHSLVRNGELLDQYMSYPNYFDDTTSIPQWQMNEFKASGVVVAENTGIDIREIEGYFEPITDDEERDKVHPDDQCTLEDCWVFTDFWRKLGIEYPQGSAPVAATIELTDQCESKLPENL